MTTIVANLECMAADRFVTYIPSFNGEQKIWTAKHSIWGAAGSNSLCSGFKKFTQGKGKRPSFTPADGEEDEFTKLEVLQLSPEGLFLWINDSNPEQVVEPFYAIGSGAGYAIGALSMGATLEQAIEVAAKWDSSTRLPFDSLALVRKRA